ncbi:hypothetical protein WDW86_15700 [Bdellovibrionota bacterium FG-2]
MILGFIPLKELNAIQSYCVSYCTTYLRDFRECDGTKFISDFPSENIRELIVSIERAFVEQFLETKIHGVALNEIDAPRWQEYWRIAVWLGLDTISERRFTEYAGREPSGLLTLEEYCSLSTAEVTKLVPPDVQEKIGGALRTAKARSKDGHESRIKIKTILKQENSATASDFERISIATTKLFSSQCAGLFGSMVISLKAFFEIFESSNRFKNPVAAAVDLTNHFCYFIGFPVPDPKPPEAFAASNFEMMSEHMSGKSWTYPLPQAWQARFQKHKGEYAQTVMEGTLFSPLSNPTTLPLDVYLSGLTACIAATTILRCFHFGQESTERLLEELFPSEK